MIDRSIIEKPVAAEFARFNDEFEASLRSDTRRLQAVINRILASTGKHIRPLLVLLAAKACGNVTESTINAAVFLELLHTATLIHDDVIDETKQRRGVPSLNAIFDNRVAVLTGDYVLSSGKDLSEGEIKQMENADESIVDEACYMQVIYKKTATLLAACTTIGAISADASEENIQLLHEFGVNLGYAFQIKDDIFDYFHELNIGKPTGNDIRGGKVTLPLLHALKQGGEEASRFLDIILQKDFTDEHIEQLISFAKANRGIEYAESKMQAYYQQAVDILQKLPNSPAKEALENLAKYVITRQK